MNFLSFAQVNKLENFENNLKIKSPAENFLFKIKTTISALIFLTGFVVAGVEQSVKIGCKNANS